MSSARNFQFKSVNYTGLGQGPRVIIMGATHGNEVCGTEAIKRAAAHGLGLACLSLCAVQELLALRRLWSLRRLRQYDVIFIYREIFPIGPALLEWLMSMPGLPPIVFDFDDAIFLPSVSEANRLIEALKSPGKVATTIRRSAAVVAKYHVDTGQAAFAVQEQAVQQALVA